MPFALAIIGILLVVAGARGPQSYNALKDLLVGDFTGERNFFSWLVALGVVGMIGYVPKLETFSRAFMGLLIVSMMLAQRGFFRQFQAAIASRGPAPSAGVSDNAPVVGTGRMVGETKTAPTGTGGFFPSFNGTTLDLQENTVRELDTLKRFFSGDFSTVGGPNLGGN